MYATLRICSTASAPTRAKCLTFSTLGGDAALMDLARPFAWASSSRARRGANLDLSCSWVQTWKTFVSTDTRGWATWLCSSWRLERILSQGRRKKKKINHQANLFSDRSSFPIITCSHIYSFTPSHAWPRAFIYTWSTSNDFPLVRPRGERHPRGSHMKHRTTPRPFMLCAVYADDFERRLQNPAATPTGRARLETAELPTDISRPTPSCRPSLEGRRRRWDKKEEKIKGRKKEEKKNKNKRKKKRKIIKKKIKK